MAPLANCIQLWIVYILIVSNVLSTRYYVDPSASSGDGTSWNDAISSLDLALASATKAIDEIWLRGGFTYIPSNPSDRSRDNCFITNYDATIYGGFDGTESSIDERKSSNAASIISGDIGVSNDITDNCYHVIQYNQILALDNVIIQDGNANYDADYTTANKVNAVHRYGGAIMPIDVLKRTTLKLTNVIIRNNTAINGGALFFAASEWIKVNVIIKDSKFEYNRAIDGVFEGGYGGAIYEFFEANLTIFNTEFNHNFAALRGGAIYQDYGAYLYVDGCSFNKNVAQGYGGAIFSEDRNSQTDGTFPKVLTSVFTNNEASVGGGAIFWYNDVDGTLTDNVFTSNIAPQDQGTAVTLVDSKYTSKGNSYTDNDVYNKTSSEYNGVDDSLTFDINQELTDLYSVYDTKQSEWDIYPFNVADTLCYVDIDNSNTVKDGSEWTKAYTDIQDCLDSLSENGGEIWVKKGTYVPSSIPQWKQDQGRTQAIFNSFTMYDDIKMYGGFDGTETTRYQRNWRDNPTYLSCQINDRLQCGQILNAADNTIVDGFVFQNAGGSSAGGPNNGGGVDTGTKSTRPGGKSGGGGGTRPGGKSGGGGRRLLDNSISETIVLKNSIWGSALVSRGQTIHVLNSIFYKIYTIGKGGAVYCTGLQEAGGTNKSPSFTNVAFLGNRARLRGGAISTDLNCHFVCDSCTFKNNQAAKKGGAVYLDFACNPTFIDSVFTENSAEESGGCIAADGHSLVTLYGSNVFTDNSAQMEGGCLYSGSGVSMSEEQGFVFVDDSPVFSNNYMDNVGNRGHKDAYGWPFSTIDVKSGKPASPTRQPTPGPTSGARYGDVPPNIVLFFIDDMHFTDTLDFCAPNDGSHYLNVPTPNIDEFMKESVLFTTSYCSAPLCSPSRFSLLTGRHASRNEFAKAHSVADGSAYYGANISVPTSKLQGNDSVNNIPYVLQNNPTTSYYTGMVGKWHMLAKPTCATLGEVPDADLYDSCKALVQRQGFDFVDAWYEGNIKDNAYFSHNPEWMLSESLKFIDEAVNVEEKPFFLHFATTLTHDPAAKDALLNFDSTGTPKGELMGDDIPDTTMEPRPTIWSEASTSVESKEKPQDIAAGTYWVDNCFGTLIQYLKEKDLYDNTFVVLMNDQGMGAKSTIYQGGSRTFNFVRYPPLFGDNGPYTMPSDFVVSFVDLAPTLFELTKVTPPQKYKMDGKSWLQDVINQIDNNGINRVEATCCKYAYIDVFNSHSIVSEEWQYIYRAYQETPNTQWTERFPYFNDEEQLYNLISDPTQQNNEINNASLATVIVTFQELMRQYIEDVCPVDECKMPDVSSFTTSSPSTEGSSSLAFVIGGIACLLLVVIMVALMKYRIHYKKNALNENMFVEMDDKKKNENEEQLITEEIIE